MLPICKKWEVVAATRDVLVAGPLTLRNSTNFFASGLAFSTNDSGMAFISGPIKRTCFVILHIPLPPWSMFIMPSLKSSWYKLSWLRLSTYVVEISVASALKAAPRLNAFSVDASSSIRVRRTSTRSWTMC